MFLFSISLVFAYNCNDYPDGSCRKIGDLDGDKVISSEGDHFALLEVIFNPLALEGDSYCFDLNNDSLIDDNDGRIISYAIDYEIDYGTYQTPTCTFKPPLKTYNCSNYSDGSCRKIGDISGDSEINTLDQLIFFEILSGFSFISGDKSCLQLDSIGVGAEEGDFSLLDLCLSSNNCSNYGRVNCGGNCTSNCSCVANTCVGQTCSDGCGGTCSGTKDCGSGNNGGNNGGSSADNPSIVITSPQNKSYSSTSISLNVYDRNKIASYWRYSLNDGSFITFTPNKTLSVPTGSNKLIVQGSKYSTFSSFDSETIYFSVSVSSGTGNTGGINLNNTNIPFCGDGVCNEGEDCFEDCVDGGLAAILFWVFVGFLILSIVITSIIVIYLGKSKNNL